MGGRDTIGPVSHTDEMVVQVHREEGKANTSESRMWVCASGRYSQEQIMFFEYQPDRSGKHLAALLKDFKGRRSVRLLGTHVTEVAGSNTSGRGHSLLQGGGGV